MAKCTKCGREEDGFVSIILGNEFQDYNCFYCAIEELKKKLRGVPFTITVPDYPESTDEELRDHGARINYIPELVDYPLHKGEAVEAKEIREPEKTREPETKLAALAQRLAMAVSWKDYSLPFQELKDWVKKISDQEFKGEVAGVSGSRALGRILSCGLPYNRQMILLRRMRKELVRLEWEVRELKRGDRAGCRGGRHQQTTNMTAESSYDVPA